MSTKSLLVLLLVSSCGAQTLPVKGPVYKLLYSPPSLATPGGNPTVMLEAEPDFFYVLGVRDDGTFGPSILSITSTGASKLVYSLPTGVIAASLAEGTNREMYGAEFVSQNNSNFYFSIDLSGKNLQQYAFVFPWGSAFEMIPAPPGVFYDIVGVNQQHGSRIFALGRLDNDGRITVLHKFAGTDGAPTGTNLVYGPDGNIYGIGNQQFGGVSPGFIFRFTPSGDYAQLVSFPSFPANGGALPLIAATDGNLYGTFSAGGMNNKGEIYQATLSGQLQTVASFPATGMVDPWTLMQASDGNLYGTTNNSYIFRYDLTTHTLTPVYHLTGNQGKCACQLIQGMDGKLYGVTPTGGNYPGIGAIFSLDIGLPRPTPVISQIQPSSGAAGTKVLLWGSYLLGATSVAFNGTPATGVTVGSEQSVWVMVPAGATTGPVTVTTANGSFTSTLDFTVQ